MFKKNRNKSMLIQRKRELAKKKRDCREYRRGRLWKTKPENE